MVPKCSNCVQDFIKICATPFPPRAKIYVNDNIVYKIDSSMCGVTPLRNQVNIGPLCTTGLTGIKTPQKPSHVHEKNNNNNLTI